MASDIILSLGLDKEVSCGQVYVIQEINACDGSFILSCILGHQIKKKLPVLLITFHQFLEHYHSVGLKMGYNLKNHIGSGLVKVLNPGAEYVDCLFEVKCEINGDSFLNRVFSNIKDEVLSIQDTHGCVAIYVDGLSHLFDLGYSLRTINNFAREVIKLVRDSKNNSVFLNCYVSSEDCDTKTLANLMAHMSDTVVEVHNLSTGRSAEVSGHMVVKNPSHKLKPDKQFAMQVIPMHYHYKLFDRGVKLFAPGALFSY